MSITKIKIKINLTTLNASIPHSHRRGYKWSW
jgi:hypothetical protein